MMMMIFSSPEARKLQNGRETKHVYNMTLVRKVILALPFVMKRKTVDSDEDPIGKKHKLTDINYLTVCLSYDITRSDIESCKGTTTSKDKLKTPKKKITSLSEYFGSDPVKQKESAKKIQEVWFPWSGVFLKNNIQGGGKTILRGSKVHPLPPAPQEKSLL